MNALEIMGVCFIVEMALVITVSLATTVAQLISKKMQMTNMKRIIMAEKALKEQKEQEVKNKPEAENK